MEQNSPYTSPQSEVAGGGADHDDLTTAFIGPKNTAYYLNKFARFDAGGGALTWHWPAFFITLFWLAYRKMWLWFFLYWLIFPILMQLLLVGLSMISFVLGAVVYAAGFFLLPPLLANKIYHNHARSKIAKAATAFGDAGAQQAEAARLGGTSMVGVIIAVFVAVSMIGVIAAISIPAYHDYTIRAQVAEGLNLARGAQSAVNDSYELGGLVPTDNDEAGLPPPEAISGQYTASIAVDSGEVIVTYGNDAHNVIWGESLTLTPHEVNGAIDWKCASADIDDRHLPQACR